MFDGLPPWKPGTNLDNVGAEAAIRELTEISFELADEATGGALNNPHIPAGYTYFGQFVDHDITRDNTPPAEAEPLSHQHEVVNVRTPRLDLDCVYAQPLNSPDDENLSGDSFVIANGQRAEEEDLPRTKKGEARIGDNRNDENVLVSQVHLAFLKLHNKLVAGGQLHAEAKRLLQWHYQWVVIHDFCKRLCGEELVDELLASDQLPLWADTELLCMPEEFSVAAYRLGHSMVRESYSLSDQLDALRRGIGLEPDIPIFAPEAHPDAGSGLHGGRKLFQFWTLQWDRFVEFNDSSPQRSRLLDTKMSRPLTTLTMPDGEERNLAFLNLLRGFKRELPSGQDVARAAGVDPIDADASDPLWLYVLKEAEVQGGKALGALGAKIVAEVFVTILKRDPESYFTKEPAWIPTLGTQGRAFQLADLLSLSGVPMTSQEHRAATSA